MEIALTFLFAILASLAFGFIVGFEFGFERAKRLYEKANFETTMRAVDDWYERDFSEDN